MAILDFVGIDEPMAMAAQSLRRMGRIVTIGIGGGVFPFTFGAVPQGASPITTLGGSTSEFAEVIALAESGRVKPRIERFPLDRVADVYEKLRNSEISGRAVVIP